MSHSTALRLCYALRLEHRRCALWLGLLESVSNSKEMFRFAQHGRFYVSLRASGASVAINRVGIPCLLIATRSYERSQ
ncbi:MAG: hypothetical protein K2N70_08655, partial [Helicobacter sp.]|nr:hypothetical protein [Helicobacter sp.]